MTVLVALFGAGLGALVAVRLGVPGGSILGAMVGGFVAAGLTRRGTTMPAPLMTAALVVIGASIGIDLAGQDWRLVTRILPAAAGSALAIIACGVGIGLALQQTGHGPDQPLLATSPGALSVLAGIAAERGSGASEVALFHLLRIIFVILSLPLLLRLVK